MSESEMEHSGSDSDTIKKIVGTVLIGAGALAVISGISLCFRCRTVAAAKNIESLGKKTMIYCVGRETITNTDMTIEEAVIVPAKTSALRLAAHGIVAEALGGCGIYGGLVCWDIL